MFYFVSESDGREAVISIAAAVRPVNGLCFYVFCYYRKI